MTSTRLVTLGAFVASTAGLALLSLGESISLIVIGAALVSGSAILMARHFWQASGHRMAQVKATGREVSDLRQGLRKLQTTIETSNTEAAERVTTLTRGVLEYVTQLQLDLAVLAKEIGRMRGSVSKLEEDGRVIDTVYRQAETLNKSLARVERKSEKLSESMVAEVSGVMSVYQLLEPTLPYPRFGGWAIDGECARELVKVILERRPSVVVEMGSGLSTVIAAQAMRLAGVDGKVISLEHESQWASTTEELLERHGVSRLCEVRVAPLVDVEVAGEQFVWYDLDGVDLPGDIGLLFIDGPPKATGDLARYPAIPMLHELLADGALVLLDDAARPDEREMLRRWEEEFPDLSVKLQLASKGLAVITKGGAK